MIEYRTLHEEELDRWFDHCLYVFNNGEYSEGYRRYFMNHWYNDPWRDLDSIFVALEGEKIASTVRVFNRNTYMFGQKVKMGGIGEVSTRPEYQGKGLAGTLLKTAIRHMEEKQVAISLLGASKWDFYRKYGWEKCISAWMVSDAACENEQSCSIRPVDMDKDVAQLKRVYDLYCTDLNGPVVRDEDCYWKMWVKSENKNFYAVEDKSSELIAYICVDKNENHLVVKEFAQLPGYENLFPALAAGAARALELLGCEIKYPQAVKSNLKVKRVEEDPYKMLRLISPFNAGGTMIGTTGQLLELLKNAGENSILSSYLHWNTDGF